jgi:hypothetical protein
MQIPAPEQKAADEMIELIAKELGKNRAVHPGTAISSCARLSGSFMFRSFDVPAKNIAPGTVVLSEKANEKGIELFNILGNILHSVGIALDQNKLNGSSKVESQLQFLDTLKLLQDKVALIMNQNNLSFQQMAFSCAMATAFIVKECQRDLVVEISFNTAVYGFIEGCKTFPPAFSIPTAKKKGIFTFWK